MFVIIYKFTPKQGQEDAFVEIWKKVTAGIVKYRGGLGSRLHKDRSGDWIAYAQWPSKEFSARKVDVPAAHQESLKVLFATLEKTEVLHEMDVVEDLLER